MEYLRTRIIYILFTVCMVRCSTTDSKIQTLESLKLHYKKDFLVREEKQAYIVTALEGCGACVEYTVKFIEKNITNSQILFIVSGRSRKELNLKFSEKVINSKNFIFDNELIALKTSIIDSFHPKVYLVGRNKVINSFEVNYLTADSLFKITTDYLK